MLHVRWRASHSQVDLRPTTLLHAVTHQMIMGRNLARQGTGIADHVDIALGGILDRIDNGNCTITIFLDNNNCQSGTHYSR